MLPPDWIVEKEARKGLTPAFQHANRRAALQVRRSMLIGYESETNTAQRGLSARWTSVVRSRHCSVGDTFDLD